MDTMSLKEIAVMKVGDTVVHVARTGGYGKPRLILRTTIARETATQWIDATGTRWRKRDGRSVKPDPIDERSLMSEADFAKGAA